MDLIKGNVDKTLEDLAHDQSRHNDDLINEVRNQLQAEQGDHKSDPPRDEAKDDAGAAAAQPAMTPVDDEGQDEGDTADNLAGLVAVPLWVKLAREGGSRLVPAPESERPRKRGEDEEE